MSVNVSIFRLFYKMEILFLLVGEGGLVLSSRFARCRDADSLTFGSVRLFKSLKTWIHHILNHVIQSLGGRDCNFTGGPLFTELEPDT